MALLRKRTQAEPQDRRTCDRDWGGDSGWVAHADERRLSAVRSSAGPPAEQAVYACDDGVTSRPATGVSFAKFTRDLPCATLVLRQNQAGSASSVRERSVRRDASRLSLCARSGHAAATAGECLPRTKRRRH